MPLELLAEIEKSCLDHGFEVINLRYKDEKKHEHFRQEMFMTIRKKDYKGDIN